ncbi:glycosyltransferase [Actinomadura roseirufa]|uniref:glycosyltransferase n=1 Tax=Actinomadura roseirufa TaxID=2094049 RepID=UPI001040ECBA|nr:glycosyltransferase [Actinomadura roseirufa]
MTPSPEHDGGDALRTLQRVVLPVGRDLDVLALYIEGQMVRGAEALAEEAAVEAGLADASAEPGAAGTGEPGAAPAENAGRRTVVVPVGRRVSFATYFNAFPAGYWRRWTHVDAAILRVRVRGQATVIVYRSSAKGHVHRVASIKVDSETAEERTLTLPLQPFVDGGWYWFDLAAGERTAVLERAEWCAAAGHVRPGTASIGITTYNRAAFCVDQLVALGEAPEVLAAIDEVLVVDQGTDRIEDHPGFAAARDALGGRLRVIDQGNLGGSGGFARSMDETVRAGRSDYVLLLDDDVVTESEGILRAIAFADHAKTSTIVGGHMFNLYVRSQLHAFGETIERYRWWWGPAAHTWAEHDFAEKDNGLRDTPWLHRRVDADYNGWWMCLIPVETIGKIGLSMPMFIKWDDAEYGVRAQAAGFPTVSLPGVAAWHVPWQDKDDGIDWQAYYHWRNRLVTALLHSPYERGGNLLKECFIISVKHALAMRYSTAELMMTALEDVLSGPEHMHAGMATKIKEIRRVRAAFADAQARESVEAFPDVRGRPPRRGRNPAPPKGRSKVIMTALTGALKHLGPVDEQALRNPQAAVAHLDQHWGMLSKFDSALVSSADGTKVTWYQRDPRKFRGLLRRSGVLHARLTREWDGLAVRYRAAAADLASPEAWRETFEAAGSARE